VNLTVILSHRRRLSQAADVNEAIFDKLEHEIEEIEQTAEEIPLCERDKSDDEEENQDESNAERSLQALVDREKDAELRLKEARTRQVFIANELEKVDLRISSLTSELLALQDKLKSRYSRKRPRTVLKMVEIRPNPPRNDVKKVRGMLLAFGAKGADQLELMSTTGFEPNRVDSALEYLIRKGEIQKTPIYRLIGLELHMPRNE